MTKTPFNKYKLQLKKGEHGITLISLVITILVLLILSTIVISSGKESIEFSKITKFSAELKIMQTEVNELYDDWKNGRKVKLSNGQEFITDEIINSLGEDINKEPYLTQANKVFTQKESGITNKEEYRYFSKELIKSLGIEEVDQDFFINIQTRSVVSFNGLKYKDKWYYTIEQLPDSIYNVEYNKENSGVPTFDVSYSKIEESKWRIDISNIKYDGGYIDKWDVNYKLEDNEQWNIIENYSFIVNNPGTYNIKIANGNVQSEIKNIIVVDSEVLPGEIVKGKNKKFIDSDNDVAIIPVGFCVVPGLDDVSQGLVISDDKNDTEIDKNNIKANGNQFVWIPVEKEENYKTNTTYDDAGISQNTENDKGYLPTLEKVNIPNELDTEQKKEKYLATNQGGFFISRYEAGDSSVEANRTIATDGTLVSKKDAYVYNYIKQTDAKEKAKTFINNEYAKSGLATGTQWDMVMAFISKETRTDGNGIDDYIVTTANSTRHPSSGVEQCGQNEADRVCNIYDLEGNCCEYVAEKNTYHTDYPYVRRGGNYNSGNPASYRYSYDGTVSSVISFRFVLYVI